jgi:ribosomal protein L16 Arg81 hydroxylase
MALASLTFDEVIAPLTRERFLSEYWTKRFLHLKGEKGRFAALLNWEKLNEVLEWQNPPPLIKLFREGNPVDPQYYIDHMDKPPEYRQLNAGRLVASLAQGASLVIDGIQKNVPAIRHLSGQFEEIFRASNLVNLYAGWGAKNTFHLHWDPQEVFILQLSGRKHWKIHAPTRPFPLKDEPEKTPEPSGPPVWEGVVDDGDLLYLPRGWWHLVHPLDEPSLHLNVGIETATGADFLRWWLPRLLQHEEVRRDLPLGGVNEDYFANLLAVMAKDGVGHNLPGEFLREWNAFRRVPPRLKLPLAAEAQKTPLALETPVRLAQRTGLFIEFRPSDRTAKFHAVGGQYDVAPQIIPALEKLSGQESRTVAELCAGLAPPLIKDVIAALEVLASVGVILKE